ncbi:Scr1 family TA system antitoxin-like transcriptional regulator [Streptosporangium canum]|nr:Scr1 family TA system antitoxin-like transcriptional regulator [Streptosporangium canum]
MRDLKDQQKSRSFVFHLVKHSTSAYRIRTRERRGPDRPIGGPEVMKEQLEHLVSMTDERLSVQVIPNGMHSGLMGGFVIATLETGRDVLYAETAVRGITTDDLEDVAVALERFDAIRSEALPINMSIDLIKKAVAEKWT